MRKFNINITVTHCEFEELPDADQELVCRAIDATGNSYAEYSHFHVGAALRLGNGNIVIGANQENVAFPSGLCAERTAIFAAQANFPDQPVEALAIAARNAKGLVDEPVSPCGACRQVMVGVEDRYGQPMRVLLYGKRGVYIVKSVRDLLPLSFADDNME